MKVFIGCQYIFREWVMVYSEDYELTHNILSSAFRERTEWSKLRRNTHIVHVETEQLLTELLHIVGASVDIIPSEGWSPMAFIVHCENILGGEYEPVH